MSKVFEIAFKLGGELTSSFKNTFNQAGSTMKMLGAAAAALGGTAALAGVAVKMGEMNDALAQMSARTGIVGEDFEALKGTAENLFRNNYGEDFNEVTTALANVKQNMHELNDVDLEKFTGNALIFTKTFEADINEVTRAANNMMSSFGIESTKAMDLFTAGAQRGLNFSDEMLDNVAEYAPLFGEMGYSAEEYFGILERGAKAGVYNLDYVNDVMKEFQIRIKDNSTKTSDYMSLLSKDSQKLWEAQYQGKATVAEVAASVVADLKKMENQVDANEIAVALFGTKWEDLESTAMYAMLGSQEAMAGFEGAMEDINKIQFDTFNAAIQGIGRILFMDLVYPLGDVVLPHLNELANFLKDNLPSAIQQTLSTIKSITPIVAGLVTTFVVYKTTMLSVMVAQKTFNTVQKVSIVLYHAHRAAMIAYGLYGGGLKGIIMALTTAMRTLNLTMLANPFILTAAAIVGIGVALYAAYKMSDRFREAMNSAFATVKNFVIGASGFIASNAVNIWNGLVGSAKGIGQRITSVISEDMITNVKGVIQGFVESFKVGLASLPGIISMVAPMLTTVGLGLLGVTGPVGIIIGAVVSLIGFIYRLSKTNDSVASGISSAWDAVVSAIAPITEVFSQAFGNFASEIGPELTTTMDVIAGSIAGLAPSFAELGATLAELGPMLFSLWIETATTVATTVLPLLLQVFQMVLPIVANLISAIVPIILQLVQTIIPLILSVVQMVFPVVLQIVQSVLPIVATLLMTVAGVILQLVQTLIPLILSVVQMVFPIVLGIIQSIIPIIAVILQVLVTVISTVLIPAIQAILAVIQFVFPYVQMIIQNALAIVNGIIQTAMALLKGDWEGAWNAIKGTAETIMNNIIAFFQGINLFEVGKSIVTGLIDGIKSMGGAVISAVSGMIPEPIRGAASKLLGALPGFAKGGIVDSTTLAWVGEGGDTESIIPWNNSQRSKDLWMQTGQALGMLNRDGILDVQQQVMMRTQNDASPAIRPEQVAQSVRTSQSKSEIIVHYNPQYSVSNPDDLQRVKEHADKDKDDLAARLEEIKRNEERTSFDD